MILGIDGKPMRMEKPEKCPKCGADEKKFVPSGGFGEQLYLICSICTYDFNKELVCQPFSS